MSRGGKNNNLLAIDSSNKIRRSFFFSKNFTIFFSCASGDMSSGIAAAP